MTPIRPAGYGPPKLPFTPAIKANGFVFVSGQASTDNDGNIVKDTFEAEFRRSIEHVKAILAADGLTLADIVQVRSYLARQEDLAEYNRLYREYFAEPYPARTTIVGCLGVGSILYEIDVVAVAKS